MSTLTIITLIGVILGLGIAFAGYQLFTLFMNILGIGLGGVVPAYLVSQLIPDVQAVVIIGVGVVGAIIGLGLVNLFFRAGLFFVGVGLGGGLAYLIIRLTNTPLFEPQINWSSVAIIGISGLVGGVVAQFMQRPLLIIMTSVQGAILSVTMGVILLTETSGTFGTVNNLRFDDSQRLIVIVVTAIIAILGGLVQFFGMPNMQWQPQTMPNGQKKLVRVPIQPVSSTLIYPAQGYYPPQGQPPYPSGQPPYPQGQPPYPSGQPPYPPQNPPHQ